MNQTFSFQQKINQLISILFPILITQIALYAMSFADTVMSGHVSPFDLAGVAIATSIWMPIYTGLNGILLAITPIVSQLIGARRHEQVSFKVTQGLYLSFVVSAVILFFGFITIKPILNLMDLESAVRGVALKYLIALAFGIVPVFAYTVLRCFIDALGHTRVTMIITLLSLPINVLLNYILIFGKFGFPMLGGVGAGVASAITYWVIAWIAFFIIKKEEPFINFGIFRKLLPISLKVWKEILIMGVPIGFAIFFETSIFAAVTLLMSNFNTVTIAAHQAAINFASFLYMIPLSIAMSLTILVGFEVGARRYRDARQYSYIGIGLAVIIASICALSLFLFNEQVALLYSKDRAVIELTKHFLLFAIFFQLSDAVAAPIQGALRGYKDVNVTFVMALISYWVVGLPVGYLLANYSSLGPFGYWIGLISGLAIGAITLFFRLITIQRTSNKMAAKVE